MKTVVIGAGPAGLTAAYQVSKAMPGIDVFEADDCVGGLARSLRLWDQTVDLGPHRFFSRDRRINELWLEVVGRDYAMVRRETRILYDGKLFCYPLEAFDVLGKLGPVEALRCLSSYAREWARLTPGDESFEDWVSHRFGRRLYEIFFKSYSEKLWGIPCQDLDADFAAQRIKKFSLASAIKAALLPGSKNRHRTLTEVFAYPTGGTGSVYQRMAETIQNRGGRVRLKTPVRKVLSRDGRINGVELASGERYDCDQVVSTMPLTVLVTQLDGVPSSVLDACRQLRFRNTVIVYLEVLNANPFGDNWIYVHSPEIRCGRITNFRNWVPQLYGNSPHTILAMEYWADNDEAFWKQDDASLVRLGQAGNRRVRPGECIGKNRPQFRVSHSEMLPGLPARIS